jgi:UDP-2-acetamido-3-amino-2,3-dideoxy-glucuronate N-acetyltransferase
MANPDFFIHPQALVDSGAQVGHSTRIWAFAHVLKGAVIGEGCNICDYVFVETGAKLGNRVTVKNGVQIYEGVEVEDDCFLGPNCVFTNDMFPRSGIQRPKEAWFQRTLLKRGCTLGANCTIVPGLVIGEYAMIAAGSVVTRDVPPYALVVGSPARFHAWVCKCGTKLASQAGRWACFKCNLSYRETHSQKLELE